ncbi:DUF5691 domain-containing protein [Novosphingobium aerophilum]|uniref:DUF5691 domain-containing protein n=1 Tax=Novosphingobium TaxID=165696 RepID=UPI002D766DE9|nr:DUF5691 domain-containing protein [Novosphingobium sp. RL4]WRT91705.1 DUF5691 domain-containing protein [Novosphingobium sp. RL4]
MVDGIPGALGSVLTRWTMGGSAVDAAPAAWRGPMGDEAQEAELRLLALSGQFLGVLTLAEPTGEVRMLADLPRLTDPPLAENLRPRARRLLQQVREPGYLRAFLAFLNSRGWTLHPGDWLPGANDDVPDIYAPWQDWAASAERATSSHRAEADGEGLTAENWSLWQPAVRRAAFAVLRGKEPERAVALLSAKIGGETADLRVRLLELLDCGLSEADIPFLEGLGGDRAPRVKALAASLLARLGHGVRGGEDAAELAGFFSVQARGLLRRGRVVVPQALKTPAQRNRRNTLMEALSFAAFAQALDLEPERLIAAWPWNGDAMADRALAEMAARSASDSIVALLAEALTGSDALDPFRFGPLVPRLAPGQRRAAAMQALRGAGASFAQALGIMGGDGSMENVIATPAGAALRKKLGEDGARPGDHAAELLALGLVASRAAAAQALEHLAAAGMLASDPRLDMLRLNAALDDRGAIP